MKRLIIVLSLIICPLLQGYAQQGEYKMAGPYEVVARDQGHAQLGLGAIVRWFTCRKSPIQEIR